MSTPSANWFSIPAHRPFLDDLAAGLVDALPGPEDVPGALLLVPTRRGARALAESFLKATGGRAVLLPQIRALGDLDEGEPPFEPGDAALDLPPAIEPMRRRFELAGLVAGLSDRPLGAAHALELADALAGFLDAAAIEEAPVADLIGGLVDLDLAEHWQVSARVLDVALVEWPRRLEALGLMDVAARRVLLLDRLAQMWREAPPQGPVIAAGSTGAQPATARLLNVIAGLPRGAVILPGLDEDLADSAWAAVDDQHPQGAMKRLLDLAGVPRSAVRTWRPDSDTRGRWRRRLINEALRPAEATSDWLQVIEDLRAEAGGTGGDPFAAGLEGLAAVTAASEEETANACALLLRETLETPGRTCALITPDLALARRVSAKLARWGLSADSTAGVGLGLKPAGTLALALAAMVVDPADPVGRLQLLKSPLVRLGRSPEALVSATGALELRGLRGPRPQGPGALKARLEAIARRWPAEAEAMTAAAALSADLDAAIDLLLAPFADGPASVSDAAAALTTSLEALCDGEDLLWAGPEGEVLSRLLGGLIADGGLLPTVSPQGFLTLIQRLIGEESVRGGEAVHPRLHIMGALESRMTRADRLVLAGLEEGVWPRGAPIDPFLSRSMRKALMLPSPERRIGLSAHDFAQAACAPEVVLLSSARRDGAPATESRWLWRLRTLAKGAGMSLPTLPDLLDQARSLDAAEQYRPVQRPAPVPPVADRPRKMAVTRIETLTRDPYAVWARDILKLFPLDRPDRLVESMARGTAIHNAFEKLSRLWNTAPPSDPEAVFEGFYLEELQRQGLTETALARERVLARETADWVADFERRRRADGTRVHVEVSGEMPVKAGGVDHTLTAKADRIEISPSGEAHILDYKTGAAPTAKMIDSGFSPQLTLTAAILAHGGFKDLRGSAGDLTYVRVTGRDPAGVEETRKLAGEEAEGAAVAALEGTIRLLAAYQDPQRGYPSRTAPQFVKTYAGDYDHLARVFEWSTGGDGEEGE
ncbi:MAG: double-strand break repair protein AddB [Caulobacter sp.]|nr:double-strand break repair protein AddB [Caulobacter sp.]